MSAQQEFNLTIQEAANELGLSTKTLRRWEAQGIITPQRTIGNQRRYSFSQLKQLKDRKPIVVNYTPAPKSPTVVPNPTRHIRLLIPALASILIFAGIIYLNHNFSVTDSIQSSVQTAKSTVSKLFLSDKASSATSEFELSQINHSGQVLAENTALSDYIFNINVPSLFSQPATFSANLTAPNILTGLRAGTGINISSGQTPTISLGNGLNLFDTIKVGSTEITASGADTFTFAAGSNVSIATDTTNKKITISSSDSDTFGDIEDGDDGQVLTLQDGDPVWADASGSNAWTSSSGSVYPTTTTDNVVIGGNTSTSFQLEVNGAQIGKALVSLNETGNQNILVASASGTNVLSITQSGLTLGSGSNLTINSDSFTDLTGSGLAVSSSALGINLTTSGTTGSTSSNSGLEVSSSGLTLLKGCTDNEILKWTDAGGWACASDTSGGVANYWQDNTNTIAPGGSGTVTDKVVLGGNTTTNFQFEVNGARIGKALVSLNETGDQNILVASASGTNVFTLDRSGNINASGTITMAGFKLTTGAASGYMIVSDGNGVGSWTDISTSGTAGPWTLSGNSLFPDATTSNLLIGSTTVADDIGKFTVSGTKVGKALAVLNDTGTDQNLLVASASGSNVFTLARTGGLTIAGAPTTAINISNTSVTTDISLQNGETIDNNVNGNIAITGNLVPSANDTYDLGDDTNNLRWRYLFTSDGINFNDGSSNIGTQAVSAGFMTFNVTNSATAFQFQQGGNSLARLYIPTAGESAYVFKLFPTINAMDGSDTVNLVDVAITNANHTGSGNYLYGTNIENITGDAQAEETGLRVGTGWDYGLVMGVATPTHYLEASGAVVGKALAALNETGDQNILVASASGTNRFALGRTGLLTQNFSATSGTLYTVSAPASVSLSSSLTGVSLDLNTNITSPNQNLTGESINLAGGTYTGSASVKGVVISGSDLTLNQAATALVWRGVDVTIPGITKTAGTTLVATGVRVQTGSLTTAGTEYGIFVAAPGTAGSGTTLTGIRVDDLTAGAGTETGLHIGTGWDTDINLADTSPIISIGDTGTLTINDGTNTLLTLVDNSNAGDLTLTGDVTISGGDILGASTTNVFNAATTLNIGSTAVTRTINIGTGTNADTINIGTGGTTADAITIGTSGLTGSNGSMLSLPGGFKSIGAVIGKALAILDETGDQNILVASASGTNKFILARDGSITETGDITWTATTPSITINDNETFTITDAATPDTFTVNTSGSLFSYTDGTSTFTFDVDTGPVYTGTARPSKKVTLVPEYPGAVFTPDGSSNVGTLTSDFCSEDGLRNVNSAGTPTDAAPCDNDVSGEEHNYYTWTSSSASQDYDIWVRWQVPSDFSAFAASDAIQAYGWRTDGTNVVEFSLFDTAGTADATSVNVATSNGQWALNDVDDAPSGTYTTGSYVTFKIHLANDTALDDVKVGEIIISYLAKF